MKTNRTLFRKLPLIAAVFGTVLFSSCSDDDDIENGKSVNVKVVNSAEASGSQDFYIDGTKVTTVSENQASNYIATTNSGNDRDVEFKKTGSSEVYASEDVDLKDNKNYTFILSGTGNSAKITAAEDDLSAPASGKAKVRFIHLNSGAGKVDLGVVTNSKLVSNVSYGDVSNFFEVEAGAQVLNVYPAGQANSNLALNFAALNAGRIYTVILKGSSEVSLQVISHN